MFLAPRITSQNIRTLASSMEDLFTFARTFTGVARMVRAMGYDEDDEEEFLRKLPGYKKEVEQAHIKAVEAIHFISSTVANDPTLTSKMKKYTKDFHDYSQIVVSEKTKLWKEAENDSDGAEALAMMLEKSVSPVSMIRGVADQWKKQLLIKKEPEETTEEIEDVGVKKKDGERAAPKRLKWEERHRLVELLKKTWMKNEPPQQMEVETKDLLERGIENWLKKNIHKMSKAARKAKRVKLLKPEEPFGLVMMPVFIRGHIPTVALVKLMQEPYGFKVDKVMGYTLIKDAILIGIHEDLVESADDPDSLFLTTLEEIRKWGGEFVTFAKLLAPVSFSRKRKHHYYMMLLPRRLQSMIFVSDWDLALKFASPVKKEKE